MKLRIVHNYSHNDKAVEKEQLSWSFKWMQVNNNVGVTYFTYDEIIDFMNSLIKNTCQINDKYLDIEKLKLAKTYIKLS